MSSTDLDAGKGLATGNKYFCEACVKKLGLRNVVEPEPKKKKPTSHIGNVQVQG